MGVYLTKMNTATNKVEKFKVAGNGAIYNNTEVVYDMTSSDASKNWGYTTGLLGGNTYNNSNINLDKYESFKFVLDIYPNTLSDIGSSNIVVEMEHITLIDGKSKILGNVPYIQNGAWSDTYFRYEIQIGQNNIYCQFYWTGAGAQSNNTKYRITKIYGILKTPSMIYTGDVLTAGNGISIENGVISSNSKINLLWTNANSNKTFPSQTISLNLNDYDFVIIDFQFIKDTPNLTTTIIGIKGGGLTQVQFGTYTNQFRRSFEVYNTGIYFEKGVGVSDEENNDVAIPKYIYGVKI